MKYYYPNLQLDPQNISSTETWANSADTKIIDVNMTKEQEKVTKETSKDLKRLISVVAESLQKDIDKSPRQKRHTSEVSFHSSLYISDYFDSSVQSKLLRVLLHDNNDLERVKADYSLYAGSFNI